MSEKQTGTTPSVRSYTVQCSENKFSVIDKNAPKGVANLINRLGSIKRANTSDFSFRIIFHFTDIFFDNNYDFGQKSYCSENKEDTPQCRIPTIHFLMIKQGEKPKQRYYNIMDSSIWNYLVDIGEEGLDYFNRFQECVLSIAKNTKEGLYSLQKAIEFVEFNARLATESYLIGTSHANHVAPFLFHSEKKSHEDQFNSDIININNLKDKKWRFLLVDDHASKSLTGIKFKDTHKNKADIIKSRIEDIKGFNVYIRTDKKEQVPNDCNIFLQIAKSTQEAKQLMSERKYDIIFLDYLLGAIDENGNSRREYGYELLKWLKNQADKDESAMKKRPMVGPDNCLYFIFISAYTTAVHERLLSEGMSRSTKYWYIGQGACPINTPELFKYYLLKLMNHRLSKLEKNIKGITETILDIYRKKDNLVRQEAIKRFHDVVDARNDAMKLCDDLGNDFDPRVPQINFETNGSMLVESIFKQEIVMAWPSFWEHLMHLVYITAFGTYSQWNEMWEEYMYIRGILRKMGPEIEEQDKNSKTCIKKGGLAAKSIENYLLQIRKNN